MSGNHLLELAQDIVTRAKAAGATDAECTMSEGDEFSVNVRMRELENLKEAGSRGAGLRILIGRKTGSAYTSDLSKEGIAQLLKSAIELADITTDDPHAGLPEADEFGSVPGDLGLFDPETAGLDTGLKIETAKRAEEAALDTDPRIFNSEGGSFSTYSGRHIFANSRGFAGEYAATYCSLDVSPVAREGESMERDYYSTTARGFAGLEAPEYVGRTAAERALRRLNPVKVDTQKVPVVFEPRTAKSLLGSMFEAVHGMAIYRHESFLADKLGEQVAGENVTIIDDGTIPGLFGSSPFDDEGVPTRRTVVVERGILTNYLLNSYAARKLGTKTTGNASRGLTGNAGIGHGNFFLEPGVITPEQIIASVPNGFYVTQVFGSGVNIVNGDYSQAASGLWIRNGELAFAVSEITIAGNLAQMWLGIDAIGSDLTFRGSTAAPTIKIGEMTVGGR